MDWVPIVATLLISLVVFIPIGLLISALEKNKIKRKILREYKDEQDKRKYR